VIHAVKDQEKSALLLNREAL